MIDQFAQAVIEIQGVFSGRIVGFNEDGDAIITGFTGPSNVVLPERLLNGRGAGDVVMYVAAPVEVRVDNSRQVLNEWAVVKRLVNSRSMR